MAEDPLQSRQEETQTTNRISGERRRWALGALLLTMFFASLNQTIVSTALPVIIGELEGFHLYAWVFTAYIMASAITVPIYGKLSDIYGRRPFYVFGLVVFILGSAVSGLAQDMTQLIFARALQGIGGGALLSMPSATMGDIFNPRERGQWMGVIAGVFGLASIIGPTLGGWITDAFGWRWVFYVNLPVAALVLLAVLYSLPRVRASRRVKLDWQGSILVAAGLLPLLLAFTWAGSRYPWTSPVIIGLFALGLVLLVLFVINERRAEEPILDPALLGNRLFAMTLLIALLVTMSMFGVLMFLPLFLQGVMGMSAREAGLALIPLTLSFVIGSIASGQIMTRSGRYKALAVVAALLVVLGLIGFLGMDTATTVTMVVRNMVVFGVGIGMLLPPMNVVAQNVFPYRIMGMVSATQQFVRSLGGVIVAPILGAVLTQGFTGEFERLLPGSVREAIARFPAEERQALLDPQNLTNAQAQEALQDRFALLGAEGEALYGQFLQVVQGALASGIHDLFVIALVFGIATLVGTFFLEEIRLKREDFFEGDEPSRQSEGNTGQDAMDE